MFFRGWGDAILSHDNGWNGGPGKCGSAAARCGLGVMLAVGVGIPQHLAESRRWYEKAAANGRPNALFALAIVHEFGMGVPEDPAAAGDM